ncbi:MAG: hypothetical protein ACFHXK_02735 [bacterium]
MELLVIPPGGAYRAALFFAVLPVFVGGLALWAARTRSSPKKSLLQKFGFLPLLLLLVVYYAVIWQWLFYNQFYAVTKKSETQWVLEYLAPSRSHPIDPSNLVDISTQDISSVTGGSSTTRLVLKTRDGRTFRSAQIARHRADDHVQKLRNAASQ